MVLKQATKKPTLYYFCRYAKKKNFLLQIKDSYTLITFMKSYMFCCVCFVTSYILSRFRVKFDNVEKRYVDEKIVK